MAIRQQFVAGQLFTLYQLGAIGDLTDRQLLERFTAGEGEPAELAFAALVERHGPMVHRVCSASLRNPHDTQDAFQATFLVLLRKAPELWIQDSMGPWLHRVARRIADRIQASARRRREFERRAAEARTAFDFARSGPDEPSMVLHEEIDGLPERYRVPVILCHLEGQSHVLAAKTLRLPVGTVKSRLHKARDLLRARLARRGLDLPAGLLTAARISSGADAALSLPLFQSFLRAAARSGMDQAGQSGLISVRTIHLVEEAIKTMFLTKMKIGMLVVLVAVGLAAGAAGVFAQPGPGPGGGQPGSQRRAEGASGPARPAAAGREPAPAYIRASRKMIIERLERELHAAEYRLDLTTERVASPSDPEGVRARKTVETLAGLMARIDDVLVEAVDEFPTMFDFTAAHADRGVLKARIEADIARGADRVDWAKRMFEKGYVSKAAYDAEILKHYAALMARLGGSEGMSNAVLERYELLKRQLLERADSDKDNKPGAPAATPGQGSTPEAKPRQQSSSEAKPRQESAPAATPGQGSTPEAKPRQESSSQARPD